MIGCASSRQGRVQRRPTPPRCGVAPLLFVAVFAWSLRRYIQRFGPVAGQMRGEFGALNALLNEAVFRIEVVKSTAKETQEERRCSAATRVTFSSMCRDFFSAPGRPPTRSAMSVSQW